MNLRLLSLALAAFAIGNIDAATQWPKVDIRNNRAGLKPNQIKICRFNADKEEIVCITKDGEPITIADVRVTTESSTATPAWLDAKYKGDYLGQSISSTGNGSYGSGRRTIYLKKSQGEWPEVDFRNNNSGLKPNQIKICRFNPDKEEIICLTKDGEPITITDVRVTTGSSTGTPPWLDSKYKGDYIGQSISSRGTGSYGSGRRTIYLKG